jgi:hypothetical protein
MWASVTNAMAAESPAMPAPMTCARFSSMRIGAGALILS